MVFSKSLLFAALTALGLQGTLALHPDTNSKHLFRRDGNERFPFCTTATNPDCIAGGKYVKPDLNISDAGNPGNNAYITYLPSHTFTVSQWTNQKMPDMCHYVINYYSFNPVDFTVYNVTYPDCSEPWVVCRHKDTTPTINQLASDIGKMPASMRQAANAYLTFPETWHRAIESWSENGLIAGKGSYYGPTALVHEHGHAIDGYLLVPGPGGYSATTTWRNAVAADGFAATAYGTTNHAENFADVGRVVLLENIYPGGMLGLFPGHPNLTQIANQVALFQSVAGAYYQAGTTCDLTKKYPFPATLVNVPVTTTTPAPTATASPYGQCGGYPPYTGPTACGPGWTCTTLNPYYAQCTPVP